MKKPKKTSEEADVLRQKAQQLLKDKHSSEVDSPATKPWQFRNEAETIKLLHELEVHQIELEMQNEQLRLEIKKAETSAKKYTNLYDFAPSGYFTLNSEGEIGKLNFNGAKLLNRERSKLINTRFNLFIEPTTRSTFNDFLNRILETNTKQSCEVRLAINEKPAAFVHIEGHFSKTEQEYMLTAIDVTKQKLADQDLKDIDAKWKTLFQDTPKLAVKGYDKNGKTIYWNKAAETFYGYSAEEAIGRNLTDLIIPEEAKTHVNAAIAEMLRTKTPMASSEAELKRKNGSSIAVFSSHAYVETPDGEPELYTIDMDLSEIKQAEEKLKSSDRIFFHSMDMLCIAGFDGFLKVVNPAWEKTLGWNNEELLEKPWIEFVYPDDRNPSSVAVEGKEAFNFENRYLCKNGDIKWLSWNSFRYDKEEIMIGVARDITERKKTEEELKEAEKALKVSDTMLRTLLQDLPNVAVQGYDKNEKTIYWNKASETFYGFSAEEAIGNRLTDLIIPVEAKNYVSAEIKQMFTTKTPIPSKELELKRKDNSSIAVFSSHVYMETHAGEPEMYCIDIDLSERKKAERELKKAQEIACMGSWYIDILTGEMVWSEELYKIYGTDTKLPPPPLSEHEKYLIPESWELLSSSIENTIRTGKPYSVELKGAERVGNNWKWILGRGEAVFNSENKIIGVRGTGQDITKRKQTESELIKAKEHAEESDRLKSAFLANMSHEIRTPMNGILGFVDLLKKANLTGKQQQDYISIIENSGTRMLNIINSIMSISKIESGSMEVHKTELDINEQIKYIYTFFKPEVEAKGIQFSFENALPSKTSVINTDREKLLAILTNLVKNAIKFTKRGSIMLGYSQKGENLEFYVKDTGIGVENERQQAIFKRFIQEDITDKYALQGAGLGLAISKAYVEMLGGKLWVESEKGKGSIFRFTIPYFLNSKAVAAITISTKNMDEVINKIKILVSEDDEASHFLLSLMLKEISGELLHARTGLEAVELCRANPDIDLILMDIKMPIISGYEATRQIREFNTDVIVIAQTAFGLSGDREKVMEAGCNDYLSKPVTKDTLLSTIKKYFSE